MTCARRRSDARSAGKDLIAEAIRPVGHLLSRCFGCALFDRLRDELELILRATAQAGEHDDLVRVADEVGDRIEHRVGAGDVEALNFSDAKYVSFCRRSSARMEETPGAASVPAAAENTSHTSSGQKRIAANRNREL